MACPASRAPTRIPRSPERRRVARALALFSCCLLASFSFAGSAAAHDQELEGEPQDVDAAEHVPCVEGTSGEYACRNIELVHFVPVATFGSWSTNDLWGWTDPENGDEYVLLGLRNATAFVQIDEYGHPTYIGRLPTRTIQSSWRDIKVYRDHAFVVAEAPNHGMQVFDLTRLRDVPAETMPVIFDSDADYTLFGNAHNLAINEETGIAYAVGSNRCFGGLHMVDIREPKNPRGTGCFSADRYTHDAQCVIYRGPDTEHQGREICFASNEDTVTIVDVTDKLAPRMIARAPYFGSAYTHQGWLTEDHAYFLLDDELDERNYDTPTRTFVWNMKDLDAPFVSGVYDGPSNAIDHNQYTLGNHVFQANYRSGIRVLRFGDLDEGELGEVAFFDTTPEDDRPLFSGTWSVYPYFESGYIVASDIYRGLYILWPRLDAVSECEDGLDNDGDGLRDFGEDATCISAKAASESIRYDVDIMMDTRFKNSVFVPGRHRNLKLGILGSPTVDYREVDVETLQLDPGGLAPNLQKYGPKVWDAVRDGYKEIFVGFDIPADALTPEDDRICLTGLLSGDAFESCVEITVAESKEAPLPEPPKGGKKVAGTKPTVAAQTQNKADHPMKDGGPTREGETDGQ